MFATACMCCHTCTSKHVRVSVLCMHMRARMDRAAHGSGDRHLVLGYMSSELGFSYLNVESMPPDLEVRSKRNTIVFLLGCSLSPRMAPGCIKSAAGRPQDGPKMVSDEFPVPPRTDLRWP